MQNEYPLSYKLHLLEAALMIGLALFLGVGASALYTQDALAEKVVRLHVLANSDSEEDQALKLQVRDVVLERTEALLRASSDREDAAKRLEQALPELQSIAEEKIRQEGESYPVQVRLERAQFPTKEYDGFSLPAGEYLALRVLIGAAAGQNWWCVVFPPLCTAAAQEVPASAMAAGLSEEQVSLITEEDQGYVLKFKTVELWQRWKANFS